MGDDLVIFERRSENVAVSILNRPEKRNALSIELMERICAHAERVGKDEEIRIWILRGNGPAFCAGLDVAEAMDPRIGVESAGMVKKCLSAVYRIPAITIAMVHGAVRGGGAGLMAACDFAVADQDATIGFPEARLGLIPAQVMSLLVRKLSQSNVRDLLLSGEAVNAERARQIGLLHRVGSLETETRGIIAQVLKGAPGALAKTKQMIDNLYPRSLEDDIEMCRMHYVQARDSAEAREGAGAFLQKRKPVWEKG